jgi:hypothetical protein
LFAALPIIFFAAFVIAAKGLWIGEIGILTGKIDARVGGDDAERNSLRSSPAGKMQVDAEMARYLFDYRLPPGCIDGPAISFPNGYVDISRWQKGDVFVIGAASTEILRKFTLLELPPPPMWRLFGAIGRQRPVFPRQLYVIPVENCKGIKPEYTRPGDSSSQRFFESLRGTNGP